MKPAFDPNKPVQLRDGRKARIVCRDVVGKQPILALYSVGGPCNSEASATFDCNGSFYSGTEESCHDLINVPVEVNATIWVNIYPDGSASADEHSERRLACVPVRISVKEGQVTVK